MLLHLRHSNKGWRSANVEKKKKMKKKKKGGRGSKERSIAQVTTATA